MIGLSEVDVQGVLPHKRDPKFVKAVIATKIMLFTQQIVMASASLVK